MRWWSRGDAARRPTTQSVADDPQARAQRLVRSELQEGVHDLRARAVKLLESGEPGQRAMAVALLRKVASADDPVEVPWAHELLAEVYRSDANLLAAEYHLRACLDSADEYRNGTSAVTELSLAEVLIELDRTEEAATLLDAPHLRSHLLWTSDLFRYCVARARVAQRRGLDSRPWARRALDLARKASPQVPRRPWLGLVQADRHTLREMRRLTSRPPG